MQKPLQIIEAAFLHDKTLQLHRCSGSSRCVFHWNFGVYAEAFGNGHTAPAAAQKSPDSGWSPGRRSVWLFAVGAK